MPTAGKLGVGLFLALLNGSEHELTTTAMQTIQIWMRRITNRVYRSLYDRLVDDH